jgi:HK97 family phage prohead protease
MKNYLSIQIKKTAEKGVYEAWANKATIDRDNELILPNAYSNTNDFLRSNPVMFYDHAWISYDAPSVGTLPIGKVVSAQMVEKQGLKIKFEFASHEFAQIVRQLVDEGVLNTLSIGFVGLLFTDDPQEMNNLLVENGIDLKGAVPKRIFTKVELLEVSVVGIPSNRDAEILRNYEGEKRLAIKNLLKNVESIVLSKSESNSEVTKATVKQSEPKTAKEHMIQIISNKGGVHK